MFTGMIRIKQEIAQLIEEASYKDSTKLLPLPKNNDIISVENAMRILKSVNTIISVTHLYYFLTFYISESELLNFASNTT